MADLRARFAALDTLPVPDLWADIERRATAGATGAPTPVKPMAPTWRLGGTTPNATRRLVLVLVLIGLLAVALLGAALVGGLLPDPLRAQVPTVPSATPVFADEPFTSDLFGYSIRYPTGWQADRATQPWLGTEPAGDAVIDAFSLPSSPNTERFSVTSRAMYLDWSEDQWIDTFVPLPAEVTPGGCRFGLDSPGTVVSMSRDGPEPGWEDTFVGGLSARMRSVCGHVDAIVFAEGRAYVLSLFSGHRVDGDTSLFRRFADTFDLPAPAVRASPSPSPTPRPSPTPLPIASETFRSASYDYTIRYPVDWTATPARSPWVTSGPWEDAMADEFDDPDGRAMRRFTVVAQEVGEGWVNHQQAWLDAFVPLGDEYVAFAGHGQDTHGHCFFHRGAGTTMIDATTPEWEQASLAGRPSHLRASCGRVDGVVFVGSRAYVLSLYEDTLALASRDGGIPLDPGRMLLFQVIADSFTVDSAAPATGNAPTQEFASVRHGYSLRYPVGWTPRAAAAPWTGSGTPDPTAFDTIAAPDGGGVRFTVASRPVPAGMAEAAWLETFVPEPAQYVVGADGYPACDIPGRYEPRTTNASSNWSEATIGGHPGHLRWVCDRIDGVIFANGRAYLLTYVVDGSYLGNGEPLGFDVFADTFVLSE